MALSTNTYTYAGGAQTFAVNFALGFIQRSDVTVRVNGAVDGAGNPAYASIEWIDDSALTVLDTLTVGDSVEVLRTVSKAELKVNFTAGADITPDNLDLSAKQGLMVYQELADGRVEGSEAPSDAANRAQSSADAALVSETAAAASEAGVAASAASASTSEANASTSETNSAASEAASAVSASAAAASETNSGTSETNSAASAAAASTSETNSSGSAASALTSENNAASSATAAAASQVAAASSAAAAAAAYDSFDDRYLGSKSSAPTVDNDGDPLTAGRLYFDSTANEMRVYDGANWIAATSAGGVSLLQYKYTATASQTTFSGADDNAATLSYVQQNLIVTLNGIVLEDGTDYTASNGTSIVLSTAAAAGDEMNILAFKSFTTADMVPASTGGTFSGNIAAHFQIRQNSAKVSCKRSIDGKYFNTHEL